MDGMGAILKGAAHNFNEYVAKSPIKALWHVLWWFEDSSQKLIRGTKYSGRQWKIKSKVKPSLSSECICENKNLNMKTKCVAFLGEFKALLYI